MANHVGWCLDNPKRANRVKNLVNMRSNITKDSRIRMSSSLKVAHAIGVYKISNENKRGKPGPKHSNETKKKLSEGRIRFLKENPDAHPWKRKDKFKSVPCEKLKELLKSKSILFVEEWSPLENRNFSIDIAFPDIKLGIEVNGNQHYNRDGSLQDYYQERHDLICKSGWTLIELHYTDCFNLDKICDIIKHREQPDYSKYFKLQEEKRLAKKPVLKAGQKVRIQEDLKWEPFKEKVLNSGIDFSKFGWVQKISALLEIASQHVNAWMKRYLPEFYEDNCFKRKTQMKN